MPQASTIDLLTSSIPSPVDLTDEVTIGGRQVGALSKMDCLILDIAVSSLSNGTRSDFVMIAWSVHLKWPD